MNKTVLALILCLIMIPQLFPDSPKVVRITSEQANIRQNASPDSKILLSVKKDTVLTLLGKSGNWLRIELPDGKSAGYVHSSIARIEDAPALERPRAEKGSSTRTEPPKQGHSKEQKIREQKRHVPPTKETTTFKKMYLTGHYALSMQEEQLVVGLSSSIYYENAIFNSSYELNNGSGFGAAFGYRLSPSIAVEIGADVASRNLDLITAYAIPHPLWVGLSRNGELTHAGKMTENTVFLNLAYTFSLRPLSIQLSAGPCLVLAQTDIIDDFEFTEAGYPYSTLSVTHLMRTEKQNVFGFNAGLGVGYSLGDSLTVLAQVRYIAAKMSLSGDGSGFTYPSEFTLGGLKLGGGLQISF